MRAGQLFRAVLADRRRTRRDRPLASRAHRGTAAVVVTTSHYSARVAAARSRAAQDMGAAMVMIMPPFFGATLTAGGPAVIEYFKQVAGAIDIPVMVQDAPMSPTPLPASLLIDLVRQVPQVQYAKIEVPQAADKLHKPLRRRTGPGGETATVPSGEAELAALQQAPVIGRRRLE